MESLMPLAVSPPAIRTLPSGRRTAQALLRPVVIRVGVGTQRLELMDGVAPSTRNAAAHSNSVIRLNVFLKVNTNFGSSSLIPVLTLKSLNRARDILVRFLSISHSVLV